MALLGHSTGAVAEGTDPAEFGEPSAEQFAASIHVWERRAQTVAAVIAAARSDLLLDAEGRGESDPVASNPDGEGREANRRVEIRYAR